MKKIFNIFKSNLNNLSDIQINNISEKSLKNRLIKKIELKGFITLRK